MRSVPAVRPSASPVLLARSEDPAMQRELAAAAGGYKTMSDDALYAMGIVLCIAASILTGIAAALWMP